jgi:hypothetical protein
MADAHSRGATRGEDAQLRWVQACATWPRLYLDTGDLLRIADGAVDRDLVAELLARITDRRVILLVSVEHIQDALPRADCGAASRMADALELFPFRAVVLTEPHQIEPWQVVASDITIGIAGNIREILNSPAAVPVLRTLSTAQDHLHTASSSSQTTRRAAQLPPAVGKIVLQCLVALVGGRDGSEPDQVVAAFERELGALLDASVRTDVIAQLVPWAALLTQVAGIMDLTPERRLEILSRMRDTVDLDAYIHSPGLYLAARLATCLSRNITRAVLKSDSVDGMHVMYFPYVDIATCDRQVYSCIVQHLPVANGSRAVRLFQNGRFREVIEAISELPDVAPAS